MTDMNAGNDTVHKSVILVDLPVHLFKSRQRFGEVYIYLEMQNLLNHKINSHYVVRTANL